VTFNEAMDHVAQGFEGLGVFVLAVGTLWSFLLAGLKWRRSGQTAQAYALLRQTLGGSLLLGLEILVAADLVRTVAVAPTLKNVLILAIIVLIRTFLSFSLEIEVTGKPPWRRASANGDDTAHEASPSMLKPKRAANQGSMQ
jgi:uncharacterized membrane protein